MATGSSEEVLAVDVQNLIESLNQADDGGAETAGNEAEDSMTENLPEEGSEVDLDVVELASTGEGLALYKGSKRVYIVPFAVPGDTVKAKIYRHLRDENYTVADFISVVTPSPERDDSRVQCKYFAACSGCQFQMLDYAHQLRLKKRIVEKAFRHFSQLPPELVPAIQDTIGSPLQYGYRTKLTPHFDGPPGGRRGNNKQPFGSRPPIGFMLKGKRSTLDIEDCPIGTDAVRLGMKRERARMAVEYGKYTRGATILLRESTKRVPKKTTTTAAEDNSSSLSQPPSERETAAKDSSPPPAAEEDDVVRVETDEYTDLKTCVTDNNGTSTEYVGPYVFHNPAGSFFQNNNSILPVFTDYIRQHILPPSPSSSSSPDITTTTTSPSPPPQIKYLIDAYSGSGLFTITLSSLFPGGSVGIDISDASITYASRNAASNSLLSSSPSPNSLSPDGGVRFLAADANALFTGPEVLGRYPPDETAVVLDPPRKGCDAGFLRQLLAFAPRRVVYVSCNVHTQARDVGVLVRGETAGSGLQEDDGAEEKGGDDAGGKKKEEKEKKKKKTRYAIESIRGFDFFPQTGHVEGVAVLNRVDE
ncbi:S-adenosyl-L-methionine-dependent methyltransferase [Hypoxylon rubiginosum]|uniref:S-adenosyl-L-methionine-dependent methyltransferase n=1 Tax=Hypoxylon rubiginosum TaxID=110542 RepID=A0ACB9YJG0_9PEZI|nr:S-adenosyl-L-methionine-dependent methyltransferase [Hypoxylon rubiginosum]